MSQRQGVRRAAGSADDEIADGERAGEPAGGRGVVVDGLGDRVRDQDKRMGDKWRNVQGPVASSLPFPVDTVRPTVRAAGDDYAAGLGKLGVGIGSCGAEEGGGKRARPLDG